VVGGSGGDKLTLDTASVAVSADLGAGDDTVTLTAALAGGASVAAGAGTDTLSINNASATLLTDAIKDGFSGFETLSLTLSSDTVAADVLAFSNLVLGASTAANVTNISAGMAGDISMTGDQATSLIMALTSTTGSSDTYKITMDHTTADTDIDVANFQIAGAEILNIVSNGTTTAGNQNSIEFGAENTSLKTINISGSSEFGLVMDGTNESFTVATTINASALSAKAAINLTGNNTDTTVTGSGKIDTVTGGGGNDTVSLGAGADIYNGSSGNDTITGGAGADVFRLTTLNDDSTDTDTYTDFEAGVGGDQIEIDESDAAGQIATGLSTTTANYVEGSVGALAANDSATAIASARIIVITDKSFANFDALDDELAVEAGADITDYVAVFLNSTSGKAEIYADDTTNTNTAEIHLATISNITTLTGLAELVASNFDVI